jgi:hypothetical protein
MKIVVRAGDEEVSALERSDRRCKARRERVMTKAQGRIGRGLGEGIGRRHKQTTDETARVLASCRVKPLKLKKRPPKLK